ncbi:hypothetical protein O181_039966 [Austropuccinia psidii MF-1]|uniref:Gag-Pol-p199 n=1 Tax=Austropuccinia psidii MF-1 TaxID=1389203 RepID=A0A9Q3DAJ7_9BASI|nr:hypothetical protein [Austropuccinia psidii MF-1]
MNLCNWLALMGKGKGRSHPGTPFWGHPSADRSPNIPSPIASRSDEWKRKWLTRRNPCFHCGEAGHWAPDCPARKKGAVARGQSSQQSPHVAAIGVIPVFENSKALLDSGATHSVVGDLSLLVNIRPADMSLSVASSHRFWVENIGELRLMTPFGPLHVKDVLHCRAINDVVLSIGHLISQQILVSLSHGNLVLFQNNVEFKTFWRNHRWFLPLSASSAPLVSIKPMAVTEPAPPSINYLTCPSNTLNDTSYLWHQRLGHTSIRNIKRLMKFNAVDGFPPVSLQNINLCHHCSISKSEHRPFHSPSCLIVTQPGDVIVADLMGPLPTSFDSKKYLLVIQDHFSRLVTVIPIADKAEAKHKLHLWMTKFVNCTSFKIKRLRTDNGAEFHNIFLSNFLNECGVIHETSIPYEHHQNGKIERTNRSTSEIARTMLIASRLPRELWPYAFRHAAWIFNQTLHADDVNTPYEIIAKKKPSLLPLRVFGAKGYLYNHLFRKDLSQRAHVGYHLGEAPDSKGWLFWIPDKRKVVKSASVKFDENCFIHHGLNSMPYLFSIQVNNLFDDSMILAVEKQDNLVNSVNVSHDPVDAAPISYKEAITSDEADSWCTAINEELASMNEQDVFEVSNMRKALMEVPQESILSTKWVFTRKSKPLRFKARGWDVRTFDVKVTFLNSLIDKPVYIWPPHSVLKLKKALYGTKQAARCWWLHLQHILKDIGFVVNQEDTSTYYLHSEKGQAMLWIHVDDGVLAASSVELMELISSKLDDALKIKWDGEVTGLVGISIIPVSHGFKFHQPDLINKLLNLEPSNVTTRSPLPIKCSLESSKHGVMDKEYLKHIGILLYIAQGSCPDISYAVNYLARFSIGPTVAHWDALRHLISYMRFTSDKGIFISKPVKNLVRCYVDANWGGEASRSTQGYILFHGDNPVAWQSKRQATVAASTAQAEYLALSFAAKECLWISHLFAPILQKPIPTLLSDNRTAIGIAADLVSQKQTRHLIREFNVINEYVVKGKILLDWVSTKDQLADIMTKS